MSKELTLAFILICFIAYLLICNFISSYLANNINSRLSIQDDITEPETDPESELF